MRQADLVAFREQFNRASDAVRVVSLVSPTCLVCQYGAGALRTVFDVAKDSDVTGLIAWIMKTDDLAAAEREARSLALPGVEHTWDGDRVLGDAFAATLGLQCSAWDVYLLYAPGVGWSEELPPEPTFWMHQLPSTKGARPGLLLNPKIFLEQFLRLIGRPEEATDDLALLLHAYSLSVVKTQRNSAEPTLEDVATAAAK